MPTTKSRVQVLVDKYTSFLGLPFQQLLPESLRVFRYLINRPGQFNYQDALQDDLPIGSGEIESAHRYVIPERLKLSARGVETGKCHDHLGSESVAG